MAVSSSASRFSPDRLARIDEHLQRYVDDDRLAGWHLRITHRGETAYDQLHGMRDREASAAVTPDTLYRIYSMTKPVTSVATMMLYEQAALALNDPVSKYIPSFADLRVYTGGPAAKPVTRPATEPMRIKHLLTHTSGLTYGFHHVHVTDEIMRAHRQEFGPPTGMDLAAACDSWAAMPLRFDPGTCWNYGVSTDVLGRVVEVASGESLDDFFADHILRPLDMTDTAFQATDTDRLAALYLRAGETTSRFDAFGDAAAHTPEFLSGGGGLVSSMSDYTRFAEMLRRGGEIDGTRLLSDRTTQFMTRNHLPGDADLATFGIPLYAETPFTGVGFGLGFAVTQDPAATGVASSVGEYGWGGLASTYFWVDPVEDLTVVFMTQLMPSSAYPVRSELKQLVYAALAG
ncbi:CubicO group peptidase (beta-lactamase class C family) [Rudaeicoccus suwonensis]|uniref:CubicO group peptidase (Beta-lactamase class C family) n=2 Tax=Rudaeicoccus suwonensis TaxID=657409 RepID=A0A561EC21_9MICO|nr:CubicO group peptidase (beta-lactamase class C family) [Rudaeicoccus suwonensis]